MKILSNTEEGIWTTGKNSKEEQNLLNSLIKIAVRLGAKNRLSYSYTNAKLTFRAWKEGKDLHIYYSWNYPPKDLWQKETRTAQEECRKCFPHLLQGSRLVARVTKGDAAREVWCMHVSYKYPKCPYGVPTKVEITRINLPVIMGADIADG